MMFKKENARLRAMLDETTGVDYPGDRFNILGNQPLTSTCFDSPDGGDKCTSTSQCQGKYGPAYQCITNGGECCLEGSGFCVNLSAIQELGLDDCTRDNDCHQILGANYRCNIPPAYGKCCNQL